MLPWCHRAFNCPPAASQQEPIAIYIHLFWHVGAQSVPLFSALPVALHSRGRRSSTPPALDRGSSMSGSTGAAGPSEGPASNGILMRKVKLHQVVRPLSVDGTSSSAAAFANEADDDASQRHQYRNAAIDRRIAEILPSLADLPILGGPSTSAPALDERSRLRRTKDELAAGEALELATIFDMTVPHPNDNKLPDQPWAPTTRPTPRKITLSSYQYEMINYQRMLLRKNIWCVGVRQGSARPAANALGRPTGGRIIKQLRGP